MIGELTADDIALSQRTGMYTQPGIASAYPELATMLAIMYRDRFGTLPFVPSGWYADIMMRHGGRDGAILLPLPATDAAGNPSPSLPSWIDTPGKRQAWNEARAAMKVGYTKYIDGKIAEGREELNNLYARVDFWKRLEAVATFIAEIPGNVVKSGLSVLWPVIAIGILGVIGYRFVMRELSKARKGE